MSITQNNPGFRVITLTIETIREAQIIYRMATLFAEKHARGPVEIALARDIEKWMAEDIAIIMRKE